MIDGIKGFFLGYPTNDNLNALVFRWIKFGAAVVAMTVLLVLFAVLT
jgi:hypothetical protein